MNTPKRRPVSDEAALDEIATMLGTAARWDSPADYLEEIATIIATTPLPLERFFPPERPKKAIRQETKPRG